MKDEKILIEEYKGTDNVIDPINEIQYVADEKGLLHLFKILYHYMIKYQYQPEKQTRSWIDSILKCKTNISVARTKVKENVWNEITYKSLLHQYRVAIIHQYQTAIILASKETEKILEKVPELFPDPDWASISTITESDFIKDFLIKHVYSYEAKRVLDKYNII